MGFDAKSSSRVSSSGTVRIIKDHKALKNMKWQGKPMLDWDIYPNQLNTVRYWDILNFFPLFSRSWSIILGYAWRKSRCKLCKYFSLVPFLFQLPESIRNIVKICGHEFAYQFPHFRFLSSVSKLKTTSAQKVFNMALFTQIFSRLRETKLTTYSL